MHMIWCKFSIKYQCCCKQNCRQKVFNRVIHIRARGLDILKLDKTSTYL